MEFKMLTRDLQRNIVYDGFVCSSLGKDYLDEWAKNYLFSQEVVVPGEVDFSKRVYEFMLKTQPTQIPSSVDSPLVNSVLRELEGS